MMSPLCSPSALREQLPLSQDMLNTISFYRSTLCNIIDGIDPRFIIIVGPCSFHDPKACIEYARKLKNLANQVSDVLFIVMRAYLEKPRSGQGWKGYINDPYLNETYCMQEGLISARQSLREMTSIGLPIASEILNPISYLYFHDLLTWGCIGARTTESQPHREIGSNLKIPLGIKNSTSGNITAAAHGIAFASRPQAFIGLNEVDQLGIIHSAGNPYSHLVLRGSEHGINYTADHVQTAENILSTFKLRQHMIIDCSHGNSAKNYNNQKTVFHHILQQKNHGNKSIIGVILESFLKEGNQTHLNQREQLEYGCSITDACINWRDTEALIQIAYQQLKEQVAQTKQLQHSEEQKQKHHHPEPQFL